MSHPIIVSYKYMRNVENLVFYYHIILSYCDFATCITVALIHNITCISNQKCMLYTLNTITFVIS